MIHIFFTFNLSGSFEKRSTRLNPSPRLSADAFLRRLKKVDFLFKGPILQRTPTPDSWNKAIAMMLESGIHAILAVPPFNFEIGIRTTIKRWWHFNK
jgi:hypothetical protein